ncbi:MAG: cation:proton antiporter [Rhodoglobus sp.]
MTELLVVMVIALIVIASATLLGPRFGVASPLVLVAIGVTASLLPAFSSVQIDPELILLGILPPLLFSAAVSLPTMNFRREFGAIGGLSVVLVVGTSLILGVFFMLVIPGVGFAWGVALGAIVSPTDAVAASIIKKTSASQRVIAMLDGESLLNDATALALLRAAIVAAAASFSLWGAVGAFAYSGAVALIIGAAVGWLNLAVRKRITDPTVNTAISFTVPFIAAVPAELLGASGLVAAVVAGIVTGIRAARVLSPQNRLSDAQNWRMIELVLEGAIFLMMGLQISAIITDVENDAAGVRTAVIIAAGALVITLLVRATYVAPLLAFLGYRSRRHATMKPRIQVMQQRLNAPKNSSTEQGRMQRPARSERYLARLASLVTRSLADIEYFRREPLGWREGTTVVWAGMRGAITVAAAQTLPADTPQRSTLVLIAFAVAAMSLLVQGGTLGALVRRLAPTLDHSAIDARVNEERSRLFALLKLSAGTVPNPEATPPVAPTADRGGVADGATDDDYAPSHAFSEGQKHHRLAVIAAQRTALLDARDNGTFNADLLEKALANLDASQIALQLRGKPTE